MLALLAGAVIFALASWRDPGYARLRLTGAAGAVHRDAAAFAVEAAPFSLIELSVNGRRAASAYVPWNAREVRFEGTPLDDGRNLVAARTTLWYAASQRAHTAVLRVENPSAPLAAGAPGAPSRGPAAQSRDARSLAVGVREQAVAAAFAVQLPSTDRAVAALRKGRIDLPAFVDDVFGAPRLNHTPVAPFFGRARPRFYVAGDTVTVSAASGYRPVALEDLPAFAGDVELANAFTGPTVHVGGSRAADPPRDARRWARDVLRLRVDDYDVVPRGPAPLRDAGGAYVWERPFADARARVTVSLAFAPFSSVDALRRGLGLPVFAFVPHVAARFLAFFHGFVLAVPMFAYLMLSRGRNPRLATVARRLIAVAVAADVFDACISAQPDVDGELGLIAPALRALPPPLMNLLVVPAVVGLVLAGLASSAAHLAPRAHTSAGALVAAAANGVAVAALGFAATVAAGYAARGAVALPLYPVLLGAVLAAGVVAALAALGWWSIAPPARGRGAFTLATLAFAVAVAVPVSLVPSGDWAALAHRAGTAFADPLSPPALAAAFLRSAAPLCPLVFGLILLAGMRPDAAAIGLDRASFVRLVMCSYAVIAGMIVIVPLGFVLAWSTYALLRAPSGEASARDAGAGARTPRERGLAVMPLALAFVIAEMLLLLPSEVRYLAEVRTPFVVLEAAGFAAVVAAQFVLPAFAFAAGSVELAGATGLRKGLAAGAWVVACSLPAWFLRADSLFTAAAVVVLTGIFYAVLGGVAPAADAASPRRGLRRLIPLPRAARG
ncbi:MAG TPA: hypothetical protein VE826_00230 [Dongiaceae bacterium]|nr:hypothetical protein [Dongiaceae bacterium]